ncbi:peroxiredoxin Q, chloroplastic-like [Humulus lupulus]|uniref:peroxiredoxin Q, chloroplastic-like n=1 Tax=Humulus lupulus TaxID=3486 RepID=UPI002B40AFDE|nr:peroxiredoxin Q, chloroplastic-like [Humulus lupulus]
MLRWKCSEDGPRIQLKPEGHWYRAEYISQSHSVISLRVWDEAVKPITWESQEERCHHINEYSLPSPTDDSSHFSSYNYTVEKSSTLYNCSHSHKTRKDLHPTECGDYDFYCIPPNMSFPYEQQCQNITLPFSVPPPPPSHDPDPPLLINFPQACAFRDSYEKFKKAGAEVIGISGDDVNSHKAFAKKYKLPYTLLADEGNKVRKEWGVPGDLFGTLPGRETYVLDKNGVVQLVYNNQFQPEKHIDETLKILKSI